VVRQDNPLATIDLAHKGISAEKSFLISLKSFSLHQFACVKQLQAFNFWAGG
jgi:hypothetical protein